MRQFTFFLVIAFSAITFNLHAQTYITATGGTITTDGNYKVHTFTGSGTFTVTGGSGTVEVLVVAGGGGGGGAYSTGHLGDGGGGGTVIYNAAYSVTAQGYTVTVGAGGNGCSGSSDDGTNGGNSVFGTITATGGTYVSVLSSTNQTGGSNANYSGGTGGADQFGQTGGAGAGGGANGNGTRGGDGFLSSITGTSTYYAGGGGAAGNTVLDYGGQGGGGNGGSWASPGQPGTPNTGGGGGGNNSAQHAGDGGSGIVIVRYQFQGTGGSGGGSTGTGTDSNWVRSTNNLYFNNGNVGIGTVNPHEKLSVNGTVLAQKVKVSIQSSDWSDYVFGKTYKLPSLIETEKFIKLHQHLQGLPSANDVGKNGLDIGNSQALLLKKIEELTLIAIQQNKEIEKLKKHVKTLSNAKKN